jgi:hypothetical protein
MSNFNRHMKNGDPHQRGGNFGNEHMRGGGLNF